jgi:molybdopterin synthase sulfur carrier subunit
MKIKINYFASLREILGFMEEEFDVEEEITVGELKHLIKKRHNKLSDKEQLLIAINGGFVHPKKKIMQDDIIALFPPVSGG